MIPHTTSARSYSSYWDPTPIDRPFYLRLCPYEQLSPQLILDDKVFRSAICLQNSSTSSQINFIGTLLADEESRCLTYVIDRLLFKDTATNELKSHRPLTGEFIIPVHCNTHATSTVDSFISSAVKEISDYCHASLPIELHRFSHICGQISSTRATSFNLDVSFDLVTVQNPFILTPIGPDCIQIVPNALLKKLNSSIGDSCDMSQSHFGYCSLDRASKTRISLIRDNDPHVCSLPLVGIWVSNVTNVQCAFVWAACIRYCMNTSLKQRLRFGVNAQQSFLLACYSSSSHHQCSFYEVCLAAANTASSVTIQYDVWTCSKRIPPPSTVLNRSELNSSTQTPYGFEFKRINHVQNNTAADRIHAENNSPPLRSVNNNSNGFLVSDIPVPATELSQDLHQPTEVPSTNKNGSLFGFPRIPPKQSTNQSPSWDSVSVATPKTPQRNTSGPDQSPLSMQSSSAASLSISTDIEWKAKLMERMKSYDDHIQSLTALISQLLVAQKQQQQSLSITPVRESVKRDVAVQSDPILSRVNGCPRDSPFVSGSRSQYRLSTSSGFREQTATILTTNPTVPAVQCPPSLPSSVSYQREPLMGYASVRKSAPPIQSKNLPSASVSMDVNPVDILKPIFQFIDNQQQKSISSLTTTYNSTDTTASLVIQQQQHVTSTQTTGISLISNGVQMQFINQRSSTTTLYPTSQSLQATSLPVEVVAPSPQKSENNLSIEVHGLEMKYLEDDQLAVAIECNRQSQKSPNPVLLNSQLVDKSLSFETEEYLRRYGLLTDNNH